MLGYYFSVGIIVLYVLTFLIFFFLHTQDDEAVDLVTGKRASDSSQSAGSSIFVSYLGKPLSIATSIQREILFIPTGIILLSIFYCNATTPKGDNLIVRDQCMDQMHLFYMALSGFILFLSLLFAFASSMYFNDTQPDSPLPWANCSASTVLLKLLRKIVIIVCYVLSYNVIKISYMFP